MWRFIIAFGGFVLAEIIVSFMYIVRQPDAILQTQVIPHPTARVYPAKTFTPALPDIAEIFNNDHTWVSTLPADRVRVLTVTGDIIPARSVNNTVMAKHTPRWPYEKIVPVMQQRKSDILFINLESPLIPDCPATTTGMIFCGHSSNSEGLVYLKVDVAGLANNHIGNYGTRGIDHTRQLLQSFGITPTATNSAVIKEARGKRFAFLAYNDIGKYEGVASADPANIKQEIADAKKEADIVVVQFHWGTEYQSKPDARQISLGHSAIDNGADIVVGNHPHWIQPVELYHGKLIAYAHGNTVFDQMWSQQTREGVIGYYTFYDKQLIDVEYLPLQIDNYGQPHFVEGMQKEKILGEMRKGSR